jgi:hypothetical protein
MVTEQEVQTLLKEAPCKSCDLDPLPTWLLKYCLEPLLPFITKIVNMSLSSACMPDSYKEAILTPLIKKALMDPEVFKNFRPVSNLAFKVIENVVA